MVDSNKSKIDLSVIITAHNEGIIAHKTMLSVFRATDRLVSKKITYEIIVHIDNGTKETIDYFSRYKKDDRVRLLTNSFGDPALSRNFAINQSRGEYIASVDGDDLCSENWLYESINILSDNKNSVARMNYVVTFGGERVVVTENKELSRTDEILKLIDSNSYAAPFVCSRNLYKKYEQRSNKKPFAYEDWQMTVDMVGDGVKQIVVPGTVLFYRRAELVKKSVLNSHDSDRSTLSASKLLSFNSISSIDVPTNNGSYDSSRDITSRIKRRLNHEVKLKSYHTIKYLKSFPTIAYLKESIKPSKKALDLPDWLIDEWKEINKIEKLTFPTDSTLKRLVAWSPNKEAGVGYTRIVKQLRKKPDTLFFVPWLIRGGADKVFINTANELAEAHPEWNIAMFQTLYHPSVWQSKLSDKVDFVDIAMNLKSLGYEHQLRLMAMFLVQNDIKRILIGNSKFAYDLLLRYKTIFKELNITVYAFAFTEIIDPDGRITDYIHEELPLVEDVVHRIVTDNTSIVDQLSREHGISKEKVHVHHQYLNNEFRKPESRDSKPIKVMWASRVARQKVPEVLLEIGKKASQDFQIDVYGDIEIHYSKSFFDGSNVNYIRGFNGINDLPVDDYDVFLYTSSADGMPNMLLEIGSKGLPIIAPNVGGVSDFIKNEETGLLIDDYRDSSAYVEALEKLKSRDLRQSLAESAQKLLKSEFTEKKWKKVIREIFDK